VTTRDPVIVDAHLDMAWNALYNGRDLTLTVPEIRARESRRTQGVAMTSLKSFGEAGVALVFATLYAQPAKPWSLIPHDDPLARPLRSYSTPQQAEELALEMLELYEAWADAGAVRIVTSRQGLDDHLAAFANDRIPGLLISMEGADPIVSPDDLPRWFARGLRVVGLTWDTTRYAGGTGSTTALTDLGRELLTAMAEVGVIHDASHLSEEAFWEAAGMPHRGLCLTHGNARALMLPRPGQRAVIPLNRHLSDEQIAEVARPHGTAERGVIGLALINDFLDPNWSFEHRDVDVQMRDQGAAHLHHVAGIAGWDSVGIGSDVDSGFGEAETAGGISTVEDWRIIGDLVPLSAREAVLGENWLRFLRQTLP
jgi:membrane dipeptidase